MSGNYEKVILFPGWKKSLEKESLIDLEARRFEDALNKLNILLDDQIKQPEIIIGKLMCLIELKQYDEAIDLSEELLAVKNEYYYDYAQIYITILFQTGQYDALMNRVTYELEDPLIPEAIANQFQELYLLSKELNQENLTRQASETMDDLSIAINQHDYERQWQLLEKLRKMKVMPDEKIIAYLGDDSIHPMIKTSIFKWLSHMNISQKITIKKFNVSRTVKPSTLKDIRKSEAVKQILQSLSNLEQQNPTLYNLLEQLLYRYIYVRFPMMPEKTEQPLLAEALENIGKEYVHQQQHDTTEKRVLDYMEDIKMAEKLYTSIIDE